MPEVWIPPRLRRIVAGQSQIQVPGATVREVIEAMEQRHPGIKEHLCSGNAIAPGMAVIVDGEIAGLGMLERVAEHSEIHFVPAIAGGDGRNPRYPGRGRV